jgi:putative membrane protein
MNKTARIVVIGVVILVAILIGTSLLIPSLTGTASVFRGGILGTRMMGWLGWPVLGGIGMILFWVLLVGGIVWLVQSLVRGTRTGAPSDPDGSPLEILKRRYAKGEITKEQFEQMKRDLGL